MKQVSLFEQIDTEVELPWRGSRAPWNQKPAAPFITISRESGSGGTSLARILARQLNAGAASDVAWSIFEGNLTKKVLQAHQLPTRFARFLPEDHVSEFSSSVGELVGLHPSLWDLVQKTNQTMVQIASTGHAIFVGRGANFATADVPFGVHVRLVAPPDYRAHYRAELYNISKTDARLFNARCDNARRRYVRDHFNADIADPVFYDLVINTARVPLVEAARQITALVQAKTPVAR